MLSFVKHQVIDKNQGARQASVGPARPPSSCTGHAEWPSQLPDAHVGLSTFSLCHLNNYFKLRLGQVNSDVCSPWALTLSPGDGSVAQGLPQLVGFGQWSCSFHGKAVRLQNLGSTGWV